MFPLFIRSLQETIRFVKVIKSNEFFLLKSLVEVQFRYCHVVENYIREINQMHERSLRII